MRELRISPSVTMAMADLVCPIEAIAPLPSPSLWPSGIGRALGTEQVVSWIPGSVGYTSYPMFIHRAYDYWGPFGVLCEHNYGLIQKNFNLRRADPSFATSTTDRPPLQPQNLRPGWVPHSSHAGSQKVVPAGVLYDFGRGGQMGTILDGIQVG